MAETFKSRVQSLIEEIENKREELEAGTIAPVEREEEDCLDLSSTGRDQVVSKAGKLVRAGIVSLAASVATLFFYMYCF